MATFSGTITTAVQLHQAETSTYLTDALIGVGFIVLFLIVANAIQWQPGGNDPSPAKRRLGFWIRGVATLAAGVATNYFVWMRHIVKPQFVSEYTTHMIVAAVVGTVVYALITFGICKIQKKDTKLASVFK